jgi:hypothetical protein
MEKWLGCSTSFCITGVIFSLSQGKLPVTIQNTPNLKKKYLSTKTWVKVLNSENPEIPKICQFK